MNLPRFLIRRKRKKSGFIRIVEVPQATRDKAIKLIHSHLPSLWPDIQKFSAVHKLDPGDVAVKVVVETILPILEEGVP